MKAALCLAGYFDSLTDGTSKGIDGYNHIKKHILDKIDTDVFIHNWQPEIKRDIVTLYKPKSFLIENQIDFSNIVKERQLDTIPDPPRSPFTILSHFYSVQKSFLLMEETGIKYDVVIKARFDLGRINRNTSGRGLGNPYAVQCINFDPTLDMNKFYVANWNYFYDGPADMWFYSGYNNMIKLTKLYDSLVNDYFFLDSDYAKSTDINNISNAVKLYKRFFIDQGIWDIMEPLETTWE